MATSVSVEAAFASSGPLAHAAGTRSASYRREWQQLVRVTVLHLATAQGSLTPSSAAGATKPSHGG
jgi:hypothetical protein